MVDRQDQGHEGVNKVYESLITTCKPWKHPHVRGRVSLPPSTQQLGTIPSLTRSQVVVVEGRKRDMSKD